ncbi:MAG: hypothetical protein ABFE07_14295 [Armatimonadia bacterium]
MRIGIAEAMAIGVAIGIAIGLAVYHHLIRWEPLQETTATFKPGSVQADGSADLTRIPTAPKDAGPAPHIIPPKAKETARARIVVKPKPRPEAAHVRDSRTADSNHPEQSLDMVCSCEPVVIDISQYLGPDGAGIIASSPDGEVDVSRSTYTPMLEQRPPPRHFVHMTAEPGRDGYTAAIGKRWGRFGVGIGGAKQPGQDARPIVGLEWNF